MHIGKAVWLMVGIASCFLLQTGAALAICSPKIPPGTPTTNFTFLDHGAVVRDRTTGLEWQRCPEGMRLVPGKAGDHSGDTCQGTYRGFDQAAAQQLVAQVNAGTGRDGEKDWRLPSLKELSTIVESACQMPAINPVVFPDTPVTWFRTAAPTQLPSGVTTWGVGFGGGGIYIGDTHHGAVRLVRGEAAAKSNRSAPGIAAPQSHPDAPHLRAYTQPGRIFTFEYPRDWRVDTELRPFDGQGVTLADEIGNFITLEYFPNHSRLPAARHFASARDYFNWYLEVTFMDARGDSSKLIPVAWKGRQAYEFSLGYTKHFAFVEGLVLPGVDGHDRIVSPAKTLNVREDVVVIPARHGLFMATLRTGRKYYADYASDFTNILASLALRDGSPTAPVGLAAAPSFPRATLAR